MKRPVLRIPSRWIPVVHRTGEVATYVFLVGCVFTVVWSVAAAAWWFR